MPFQSEEQRRFLHANHPEIAKRWEKEYSNGGILDITGEEESTTDDGNDIELTAFNAAFDDPNDLSTGVRTLFMKKGGHAIGGGTIQGEPRGDRTGFRNPHGGGGQYGGSQNTGNQGSDKDHSRFDGGYYGGDTKDDKDDKDDKEDVYHDRIIEVQDRLRKEALRDLATKGPGSDWEKYSDYSAKEAGDLGGYTKKKRGQLYSTRTRTELEEAQKNQRAALNKWGIGQLANMGIMLATMLAMGIPFTTALKAVPKTVSVTKTDVANLVKVSIPVMKAKKEHLKALDEYQWQYVVRTAHNSILVTSDNEEVKFNELTPERGRSMIEPDVTFTSKEYEAESAV